MDTFCNRKNAIHDSAQGAFTQNKLDRALLHISAPVSQTKSAPPKGLQAKTLERIKLYLQQNPGGHTCDDIAGHVDLSVVTVRRYVNYLVEQSIISSDMDYNTGGRPCIVYHAEN